jgi:hypothetical protein
VIERNTRKTGLAITIGALILCWIGLAQRGSPGTAAAVGDF